jgi:hypothetical protein
MHGESGQKKSVLVGGGKKAEAGISVGCIEHPERLVKKAEGLLASQAWEEVVVGLALLSGRCVLEVLKTGVIMPKTRYSLVFTAYQEQADQVLGPFELPTLVEVQMVLSAWQRVRGLMDCEAWSPHEMCTQYRKQIEQCAKGQFGQEVPLVCGQGDWYTPLYARIYPLLATRYYCPCWVDEITYMATIQNHQKILETTNDEERFALARASGYYEYVLPDASGKVDVQRGIRLSEPDVEVLSVFKERRGDPVGEEDGVERAESKYDHKLSHGNGVGDHLQTQLGEMEEKEDDQRGERACVPKSISSNQESEGLTEEMGEENEEILEEEFLEAFWNRAEEEIRRERAATAKKHAELGCTHLVQVHPFLCQRIEAVRRREGTSTPDGTLTVLLNGYEWLHRGGAIAPLQPKRLVEIPVPGKVWPITFVVSQTTYERLVAMRPERLAKVDELEQVIAHVLDTYEWLQEGGLVERMLGRGASEEAGGWRGEKLHFEYLPLWWQNRLIEDPEAIVEKARTLLTSRRWEEKVVGLTMTTGRCVSEVLKTGVVFPKSKYVLWFASLSQQGGKREEPFELPTLVESALVLQAWQEVRKLKECSGHCAQEVCERYRPPVLRAAVSHFAHLLPCEDQTDWYTPLLRRMYARIAARYYCPVQKRTDQFIEYVQHGSWSSPSRSGAYGCAACWRLGYNYEISNGKGNIDGRTGLKLNQEGVELLEICRDEDEE